MAKNTGTCKNKNCHSPISEHGDANTKRYCEKHYESCKEKTKKIFESRISKIADNFISSKKLTKLQRLIDNDKVREEITRKKVKYQWISQSIKRKSNFNDILKSREWKNTQELMKGKVILCSKKELTRYIQDACQIYLLKLLFSRKYLDKNNSHKRYIISPKGEANPIVTLNLEVAYSFNPFSNISTSSNDIILIPTRIRKSFALKKTLLKNKLTHAKNNSHKNNSTIKKRHGLYGILKSENTPAEVNAFMDTMRVKLALPSSPFTRYPPFLYCNIEESLPLFHLAQMEYIRIHKKDESHIFINLKKTPTINWIYLEAFALLSFHALMARNGKDILKKASSWIESEYSNDAQQIYIIKKQIEEDFKNTFNVDITAQPEFIKIYNSCFSENVVVLNPSSKTIESIRRNIFKK
ncbi:MULTISPECIES: hypothetical protein [Enterobacteriaceae]|uniref:hypothetical protein n=1 Tax=Enterobacteriaceae TaxID=543 RepID=UPI000839D771|nr:MULTISPECIES: hypothetical protein [Enterobacteriaceae]MDT7367303.1 hypothetical protein [Citrobacter freundii]